MSALINPIVTLINAILTVILTPGWKRLYRSEQSSEVIDEQSVTEYKVPTHGSAPPTPGLKRHVKVMVNVATRDDNGVPAQSSPGNEGVTSKMIHFTIDFRKPELRCDAPDLTLFLRHLTLFSRHLTLFKRHLTLC